MNVLVTLNSGQGADLGPNFNLTANVGSVTPSTATLSELLAGKSVVANASATQITVTSTGSCTNSLNLTIV
jgi:predicted amino acid racemase